MTDNSYFQSNSSQKNYMIIGLVAMIAGGIFFCYQLSVKPVLDYRSATNWQETPCKIVSSNVEHLKSEEYLSNGRHRTSDSGTYRANFLYEYSVAGQQYQGRRYDFSSEISPSYSKKAQIVEQYPAGSMKTCYVNPADPDEAVLKVGYDTDYLWESLPLIAILVGVIGLLRIKSGKPAFDSL